MLNITCLARLHRDEERIFLDCPYSSALNSILKKLPGTKWSQTHKQWHLPLHDSSYKQFSAAVAGIATIDNTLLKDWLVKKKQGMSPELLPVIPAVREQKPAPKKSSMTKSGSPAVHQPVHTAGGKPLPQGPGPLNSIQPQHAGGIAKKEAPEPIAKGRIAPVNSHIIPAYRQQLVLMAYSPSTLRTYLNEMTQFLQELKDHAADEFTAQRLKDYLQYCFDKLQLSENTLHSRINALKFYYEQVLKKEKFFFEIPRPKKPSILPKLLNEDEIRKLFRALTNKKHKAMLFVAYSAGLRVSEIVNLKIEDIDSTRMQIFIERAKGKKDRYVNLSPLVLDILRKYLTEYKPKPKVYLFESEQTGTAYPIRTVQQIFSAAKHKAGIAKTVGVHSLRHSFATHLLDKGTDIKYIKDLLGHFNIKTTERYLHVSKKQLVNIVRPFDDLWKTNNLEW